jgi:NTE family protein
MNYKALDSASSHKKSRKIENVLVLQGGGSLGAFACGVFKALVKEKVKIDIVAGTSIGAINAAIIAGSKSKYPEVDLENFWLDLAESTIELIPDKYPFLYDVQRNTLDYRKISSSSANAALFGVRKMFTPRWELQYMFKDKEYFNPAKWTYLYDHTPLANTLEKYIDYKKISPFSNNKNGFAAKTSSNTYNSNTRLIITSVNVLTADPIVFDSYKTPIESKHLLASSGYPSYGFPWVELENGVYGWDGSLLSNTPVREVIYVSPRNDKNIFIVENYSRKIDSLPANMTEVLDRAKDIIFSDKTIHNLRMSKVMTRQIQLIEKLYDFFEKADNKSRVLSEDEQNKIKKEYNSLVYNYGAEILSVTRIIRDRIENPNVSKNADFSIKTIKELILQGERNALNSIKHFKENKIYNYASKL